MFDVNLFVFWWFGCLLLRFGFDLLFTVDLPVLVWLVALGVALSFWLVVWVFAFVCGLFVA